MSEVDVVIGIFFVFFMLLKILFKIGIYNAPNKSGLLLQLKPEEKKEQEKSRGKQENAGKMPETINESLWRE